MCCAVRRSGALDTGVIEAAGLRQELPILKERAAEIACHIREMDVTDGYTRRDNFREWSQIRHVDATAGVVARIGKDAS